MKMLWRMWILCFVLASSQPSEVQAASSIPPWVSVPESVRFSGPLLSLACLSPTGTFRAELAARVSHTSALKASAVLLWVCPTRAAAG